MTTTLRNLIGCFIFFCVLNTYATTSETFDLNRYSNAGEGRFKTFHVEETQLLNTALESGVLGKSTEFTRENGHNPRFNKTFFSKYYEDTVQTRGLTESAHVPD